MMFLAMASLGRGDAESRHLSGRKLVSSLASKGPGKWVSQCCFQELHIGIWGKKGFRLSVTLLKAYG